MKLLLVVAILALTHGEHVKRGKNLQAPTGFGRYAFYRTMERERVSGDHAKDTRRVFGGEVVDLSVFPAMAALLDRFWTTRCSGSVIKPYWVLTAAHCVTSRVAYVRYNSHNPTSSSGNSAHVLYLYRHPNFKVVQEDEGRGMDVTLLHHDLGLIRTRDKMILTTPMKPLDSMAQYKPSDLEKKEVMVLGYGKTNKVRNGGDESLYAVKLLMSNCDRGSWYHCMCGMATPGHGQRGVCSGDSGGPVVYNKAQVGVTSMGPVECVSIRMQPPEGATSVFTSIYQYVDLINATIHDAEKEITRARQSERVRKPRVKISRPKNTAVNFLRIHIPIVVYSLIALML